MELLLSTHDTGYERPDGPTIAKVLASLDGGRNVVATLGTSDATYLQASGSVQTGFGLDLQEGSLARRFRTRDRALPLAWVTEAFQRYATGDLSWRDAVGVGAGAHRRPARVLADELAGLYRAAGRRLHRNVALPLLVGRGRIRVHLLRWRRVTARST